MSKADRGFASMNPERVREIARMGGKASHQKKAAHEWTREEAIAAGKKSWESKLRKRNQQANGDSSP